MTNSTSPSDFEQFLLAEYGIIAEALFNTGSAITRFLQFYLVILTIPITVAGLLLKDSDVTSLFSSNARPVLTSALVIIALVGACVMCYVVNLRLDVVLYSRTVNGIRHHFAGKSGLTEDQLKATLALPRSTSTPSYIEPAFFTFVVAAFGLMNSVYLYAAARLETCEYPGLVTLVFFALHFAAYFVLGWYRERFYLK